MLVIWTWDAIVGVGQQVRWGRDFVCRLLGCVNFLFFPLIVQL
jgi:hypothetical protein